MSDPIKPAILLVDDDALFRDMLGGALREAGYEVMSASEHEEAIAILNDTGRRVDMLLTDIVMPKVHGFFLARMAVVRRPDIKIVYVSVHHDLPRHEKELAFGPVLEKTGDPADIVAVVRKELSA